MNDPVREKLCEIVRTYGASVAEDPRRCEALLRDFCGEHRREIFVLVSAMKERVVADLARANNSVPLEALVTILVRRLETNLGLVEGAASWAVESWVVALGKWPEAEHPLPTGDRQGRIQRLLATLHEIPARFVGTLAAVRDSTRRGAPALPEIGPGDVVEFVADAARADWAGEEEVVRPSPFRRRLSFHPGFTGAGAEAVVEKVEGRFVFIEGFSLYYCPISAVQIARKPAATRLRTPLVASVPSSRPSPAPMAAPHFEPGDAIEFVVDSVHADWTGEEEITRRSAFAHRLDFNPRFKGLGVELIVERVVGRFFILEGYSLLYCPLSAARRVR